MGKLPKLAIINNGKVFLFNLPSSTNRRQIKIGEIKYIKKTFYSVNRSSEKHVFKNQNLLAFSSELIYLSQPGFYYLCIPLDGIKLWTSILAIKKFGSEIDFRSRGYELQIGLPLDKFKKSKKEARAERKKLLKENDLW
jgi:hypothetical protein